MILRPNFGNRPPNAGRLRTGSYGRGSGIKGNPFGSKGVRNGNRFVDSFNTIPSASLATVKPQVSEFPLNNFHDTGTLTLQPAATYKNFRLRPSMGATVQQIAPHERNALMFPRVVPIVGQVGGVSPDNDTPFHPTVARRQIRVNNVQSSPYTEKLPLVPSFTTASTLVGVGGNENQGARWSIVKRGAAG